MVNEEISPYQRLGGKKVVRRLVDRFYDLMDELPEAQSIRAMHPQNLANSRDKLFKFLSGWLGGPQLYVEEYGHPRLRARHMPFPINEEASKAWMLCMERALAEMDIQDELLLTHLKQSLQNTATHMRNR